MSGHVSLDARTGFLQIRFPYSPALVALIKSLPDRRWDPFQKLWLAPAAQAGPVMAVLEPRGFSFDPEVRALAGKETESPGLAPDQAFTVSQLGEAARAALARGFPGPVWLMGELQRVHSRPGGFCYLEIVEKRPGEEGIAASLSGVLFGPAREAVEARLRAAGGQELQAGVEVRLLVQPEIYAPRGQFQVVVRDVDPYFTLGRLAARREEILRALAAAGLEERNRCLPWPGLPLRVGLITSWESNAFHDFTGVLLRSGYSFAIDCADVRVQGTELEAGMLAALDWFDRNHAAYDLLAVVRGGGSPADLAWFDNLEVALAVARHPLKILVGIGHTQDRTVLDSIAHSARTPTAAAEEIAARVAEAERGLEAAAADVAASAREALLETRGGLTAAARRLAVAYRGRVRLERARLDHAAASAFGRAGQRLEREGGRLMETAGRMDGRIRALIRAEGERLAGYAQSLPRPALVRLARAGERLESSERELGLLHPRRVLERGFALVRDGAGRVLRSRAHVNTGERIVVELLDGSFGARVTTHEQEEP